MIALHPNGAMLGKELNLMLEAKHSFEATIGHVDDMRALEKVPRPTPDPATRPTALTRSLAFSRPRRTLWTRATATSTT